jgi:hypothetical protein
MLVIKTIASSKLSLTRQYSPYIRLGEIVYARVNFVFWRHGSQDRVVDQNLVQTKWVAEAG